MRLNGESFGGLIRAAAERCVAGRAAVGVVLALVLAVAAAGLTRLAVDPSPEAYLEGTSAWRAYAELDRTYEIGEAVIVGLREAGGTVFDPETVHAVVELDRALSDLPSVERVLSLASATALDRQGDTLDVRPLLGTEPVTPEATATLAARVREHPVYGQALVDARHESTFLFVQLSAELSARRRFEAVRRIRAEVARFETRHRTVHLAGSAVTKEAIAAGVRSDAAVFLPAALALFLALLWIFFGEPVACLVPLLVAGVPALVALGLLGLLALPLSMATAAVPALVLVLGLAEGVQILVEVRRRYARTGDPRESLFGAVEALAFPSFLVTAAVAAGLLSLLFSRVAPLRSVGPVLAAALLLAYPVWMLLTPLLLWIAGHPRGEAQLFPAATRLGRALGRFAVRAHRHLAVTLAVGGLLAGGSWAALARLDFDSSFVRYFDPDHQVRRDLEVVESTLGGAEVLELMLAAPAPGYFQTPQGLAALDRVSRAVREVEGVTRVFSLADYMRLANGVMLGLPRGAPSPLPDSAEAVAQLTLLDPSTFAALVDDTLGEARVPIQLKALSQREVQALVIRTERAVGEALAGSGVTPTLTGLPAIFARMSRDLVDDGRRSFGLAAAAAALVMLLGLRSLAQTVATMIPAALAVGLTFGTMGVAGLDFDLGTSLVGCLGMGISITCALHVAARYRRARAGGSPSPEAGVQYAVAHAGLPVILTGLLLGVGFSVLCLSPFAPTYRAGLLLVLLVGYTLALDLVLLPVLLVTADRVEARWDDRRDGDPVEVARFRELTSTLTAAAPRGDDDAP